MLKHGALAHQGRHRGFTLIELMTTIALASILLMLAMPSLTTWVRNAKVRAVSDALQTGLRQGQMEALRRSRQVVFSLTNSTPTTSSTSFTAAANGSNWAISLVKSTMNTSSVFLSSGLLTDVAAGVQIQGPVSVCFSSMGRLTENDDPGVTGAACELPTSTNVLTYDVSMTGSDRPLRVLVALGGQVRMCDPAKELSASAPDGCPKSATEVESETKE